MTKKLEYVGVAGLRILGLTMVLWVGFVGGVMLCAWLLGGTP
ncbi:hypothetical protein [Pseudomonas sp. gcc21]|nr:hypothetical protein [Pseudomonas sp. gcc21]